MLMLTYKLMCMYICIIYTLYILSLRLAGVSAVRPRQTCELQTGEVYELQAVHMGKRQAGGAEGVMEQEVSVLPKKKPSKKES